MRLVISTWQRFVAVLLALSAFPATPAQQAPLTAQAVMPVTMEIVASCLVSATDLDFGAYVSSSQTPVLGQTVIELRCGPGTTAELLLDAGTGSVRNTRRRQMGQDAGTDRMDYELYQDPGRTIHWGDRSGTDTVEVVTTGTVLTVPVYGRIPGQQRVRDGTYSDTITVTVQY